MTTTKAGRIAIQKPSLPLGSRTCVPLYSEDYGKHRPYLRLFDWRVLSIKYDLHNDCCRLCPACHT